MHLILNSVLSVSTIIIIGYWYIVHKVIDTTTTLSMMYRRFCKDIKVLQRGICLVKVNASQLTINILTLPTVIGLNDRIKYHSDVRTYTNPMISNPD